MEDLISRAEALKALKKRWEEQKELILEFRQIPHHYYDGNLDAQAVVNTMPSVRPERMKARWLMQYLTDSPVPTIVFSCSACHGLMELRPGYDKALSLSEGFGRYCPWCGAEMEEEKG